MYDWLGRAFYVSQDLGDTDDDGAVESSAVTTRWDTSLIPGELWTWTERTVNGVTNRRREKKNVLGKVSKVLDPDDMAMVFSYDVEGNLTDATDALKGNTVHNDYYANGLKKLTRDPDLGEWTYTYDGFGNLTSQTDAKKQTTTMTYDALGRMLTKTDETGTAEWIYDEPLGRAAGAGVGKVAAVISAPDVNLNAPCDFAPYVRQTGENRAGRVYSYTRFGEVSKVDECIDGEIFSTSYLYDEKGRQSQVTYPQVANSSFAVKYKYTSLGFLHSVVDASDESVYWAATATNASGQVTEEFTRNGVETVSLRNPSTGWLMDSTSTAQADNGALVQKWSNRYDEAGNLRTRKRYGPVRMGDSVETFEYDLWDRLTSSKVTVASERYNDVSESFSYDHQGNLIGKGGKTYTYGTGCVAGGGPHAVCSVDGGEAFAFDANGNMTSGNGHLVSYTPFNKVSQIVASAQVSGGTSPAVAFVYGADGNRIVQSSAGSETTRTVYVGMGGTGKSLY